MKIFENFCKKMKIIANKCAQNTPKNPLFEIFDLSHPLLFCADLRINTTNTFYLTAAAADIQFTLTSIHARLIKQNHKVQPCSRWIVAIEGIRSRRPLEPISVARTVLTPAFSVTDSEAVIPQVVHDPVAGKLSDGSTTDPSSLMSEIVPGSCHRKIA